MTLGAIIVITLRLVVPLLIFRKPLEGGIASMLLDGADVMVIDAMQLGGFGGNYHQLDKLLDMYYLSFEFIVALRWDNTWAKYPAIALFGLRMVGFVGFELTQARILLFIFPNMFENWWLYAVAVERFKPAWRPHSVQTVAIPMLILLIPKMGQEYLLHFSEAQPWSWFKSTFLVTRPG